MLLIYAIKRLELLIIWRDINFDKSNPKYYKYYNISDYNKMILFNEEMKNFDYREIKIKIYYDSWKEEWLKLIDRKKNNKIILITNGRNNWKEFIIKVRGIIN